jgi:hypothetical protein
MDIVELRATVNQLVEAWHDQQEAPQQLNIFKANNPRPTPPPEFEGLQQLTEFDERRRTYEAQLTDHEDKADIAMASYEKAADKLRDVLPENTSLQYTYQGERGELEGGRYFIVNTEGNINIRWHTRPETPPP